jgi:hypothetical protein
MIASIFFMKPPSIELALKPASEAQPVLKATRRARLGWSATHLARIVPVLPPGKERDMAQFGNDIAAFSGRVAH